MLLKQKANGITIYHWLFFCLLTSFTTKYQIEPSPQIFERDY